MEKTSHIWIVVMIIVIIVAGVYMSGASKPAPGQIEQKVAPVMTISTPSINSRSDEKLGNYLAAPNGMTLYIYTPDKPSKSNCTGSCAVNWPPYTIASVSDLTANPAIPGQLSTIRRADGSLQVTFNSAPLYFYIKDKKPGDVVGQNVGGLWYVVSK